MIAPGIRVVRGPDWIWQNQGKDNDTLFWLANGKFICYGSNQSVMEKPQEVEMGT